MPQTQAASGKGREEKRREEKRQFLFAICFYIGVGGNKQPDGTKQVKRKEKVKMGFSLEFGRYGAEGLGKLAESKPIREITQEVIEKLYSIAKKFHSMPEEPWTKKVINGRSIFTNARGEKIVEDAAKNRYVKRELTLWGGDIAPDRDGTPLLHYMIDRPKSSTIMAVKLLENGKFVPVRSWYMVDKI